LYDRVSRSRPTLPLVCRYFGISTLSTT
jgi:hypothetical protein